MKSSALNGFINELEKNAGFIGQVGKVFNNLLPAMAVATGLGVGIEGTRQAVNYVKNKKIKNEVNTSYDVVLEDPAIQDAIAANSGITEATVRGAFNVLAKFAPALAATPEVAKPFIRHAIASQGGLVDPTTVGSLVKTHKEYSDTNNSRMDIADRVFSGGTSLLRGSILPENKYANPGQGEKGIDSDRWYATPNKAY